MTKHRLATIAKVIAIPTLYAIVLRFVFDVRGWDELYNVMSVTFLLCLPTIMGALTIYFSSERWARDRGYTTVIPWIPLTLFVLITLACGVEGGACWAMVFPLFMISSSIGGFIGRYYKLRNKDNRFYLSVLTLLPLVIAPVENMIGAIPGTYKAYTYIDIQAPAEKIWTNVTRVREIKKEQDSGWLTKWLGFPRPVEAELNYEGVGAYRAARFTNGLVFHETVLQYEDKKKMVFAIKAYPYEIPSTTMDEHVVIGGKFFDVLTGTYELEKLSDQTYRLHLYSHFQLTTTFNFYASWWARWIMQDIQNNILRVVKARAEGSLG